MWNYILPPLLFLSSVFLILLVLIQRGRGGGLAGAFGGLGGQSAFGTKAGDLFTRITIGVAAFWIILCAASVKLLNQTDSGLIDSSLGGADRAAKQQADPGVNTKSLPATDATKAATPPASAPATEPAPAATAPAAEAPASPPAAAPEAPK